MRHPKASAFVQQRLFAGLSSFAELEQRIASLPAEKSRGDALEVFAEAYLATQRKHDAESVWPLATAPLETLARLQLATQDYGVDGVLQTRLGKFSVYQVKFRTGRPALTWRELSTFMALADSPNIHSRILLTNCDELPSVLNDRQGFFCIRGSDLDRLGTEDFKTIAALAGGFRLFSSAQNAAAASGRSVGKNSARVQGTRPRLGNHGVRHGQNPRRPVGGRTYCQRRWND